MEETKVEKKSKADEMADLKGLVESLSEQVSDMKKFPQGQTRVARKREKEHTVSLRQYEVDGMVKGIVTRIHSIKEVKDRTEAKRLVGMCVLEILEPETGKKEEIRDVDYLAFLNDTARVTAKVLSWNQEKRFEIDPRKGGGGVGAVYKQSANDEYVVDTRFEYEVGYVDNTFTLEILDGVFAGKVITTDERALNI